MFAWWRAVPVLCVWFLCWYAIVVFDVFLACLCLRATGVSIFFGVFLYFATLGYAPGSILAFWFCVVLTVVPLHLNQSGALPSVTGTCLIIRTNARACLYLCFCFSNCCWRLGIFQVAAVLFVVHGVVCVCGPRQNKIAICSLHSFLEYFVVARSTLFVHAQDMIQSNEALVNAKIDDRWTVLHHAAFFGNMDMVNDLLRRGATPLVLNSAGQTPRASSPESRDQRTFAACQCQLHQTGT